MPPAQWSFSIGFIPRKKAQHHVLGSLILAPSVVAFNPLMGSSVPVALISIFP
jgi:hypothetical protein